MSKLKKVVAAIMAAATVGTLSISAFAVDYKNTPFDFNLGQYSNSYSTKAQKQDDLGYAMVNCKEGNVDSTAYIWMYVCRYEKGARVSEYVKITELNNHKFNYTATCSKNQNFQLYGYTGSYGAYVKGKWDP